MHRTLFKIFIIAYLFHGILARGLLITTLQNPDIDTTLKTIHLVKSYAGISNLRKVRTKNTTSARSWPEKILC